MNTEKYTSCKNKTLLVVDDDPQNRVLIIDLMLNLLPTITVLAAKHGKQAIEILEKKPVDILLLDWEMSEMNGLELLKYLKAHETFSAIPVIMHTGAMTGSEHLEKALEWGAWDFLRKPADPMELLARLNSILYQKELEKERIAAKQALLLAQKQHLENELSLLKQETNNYLLLLSKKNELLSEIKDKCAEKDTTLKSIALHIHRILEQEDYWDEFIEKFNRTDQDFTRKILEKIPDLSASELKMSVLIRLGMDNKTIANLLNISSDGVKKSRYRLRKRIGMEQEDRLDRFILEI